MKRRLMTSGYKVLASAIVLAAACSSTDSTLDEQSRSEPVSSAAHALESGIDGGATQVLLNEVKINPDGNDGGQEYVELRGTPGGLLTNVYLVVLEGELSPVDSGNGPLGEVDYILDLGTACAGPCALGSNGLLLVGAPGVHSPPAGTTYVSDPRLSAARFENSSASFLLVYSDGPFIPLGAPDAAPPTLDLDSDDDGQLDFHLPPVFETFVIDGIGYAEPGDFAYGARLTITGDTPAAATRFPTDTRENTAAAWFYGELAEDGPDGVAYDDPGVPLGAVLTPGAPNFGSAAADGGPEASTDGGGSGGATADGGAGTGAGGGAGTGGAATDGSAGTGAGGAAGTGGTAGTAGGAGSGGRDAAADARPDTGSQDAASESSTGGSAGSGGSGGSAGSATAGTGGRAGSGGRDGGRAGSAGRRGGGDDDDDGCSCSTPASSHSPTGFATLLAALGFLSWRRRRH